MSNDLRHLFGGGPADDKPSMARSLFGIGGSSAPSSQEKQQKQDGDAPSGLAAQQQTQAQGENCSAPCGQGLPPIKVGSTQKQRPSYKNKAPASLATPSPLRMPAEHPEARPIHNEEGLRDELGKIYIGDNVYSISDLEADFELGAELGHGTFGSVYSAVHKASKTKLAVKLLRDTMRPEERKKLIKELTLSRKFDSPYTVRYHGINVFDGQIQLFVELMRMSLDVMIKHTKRARQHVPEAVLGHITCCLIKGLDYMWHEHRAMHRDIKPSNALIGFDGSIKLCDFGLANIAEDSILISNVGSELYLSPEQLNPQTCQQGYDVRRDVWSLGVTLLEIANLEYPFRSEGEKHPSAFTVMQRVTAGEFPPVKFDYSETFGELISSCLEKDARWRPYFRVQAQPLKRVGSVSGTPSRDNSTTSRANALRLASIGDENPFAADMREALEASTGQQDTTAAFAPSTPSSAKSACSLEQQSPRVSAEELARREGKKIHPALMDHAFFRTYEKVDINVARWIDSLLRLPDVI